jgi:hypothetical protein
MEIPMKSLEIFQSFPKLQFPAVPYSTFTGIERLIAVQWISKPHPEHQETFTES